MSKFCVNCGNPLPDNARFCTACGTPVQQAQPPVQQNPVQEIPVQQAQPVPTYQAPQPVKPKKKTGMIIGIAAGVACLLTALFLLGAFVWPGFLKTEEEIPDEPVVQEEVIEEAEEEPLIEEEPEEIPEEEEPEEPEEEPEQEPKEIQLMNPFTDITEDNEVYPLLLRAHEEGIISGGEFKPEEPATRAQMVTFMWRASGQPEPALKQIPFSDVPNDSFYAVPVKWAYEQGIVTTAKDGKFNPEEILSRDQAAMFLYRFAEADGSTLPRAYADVREGHWSYPAVNWICNAGIADRDETWMFNGKDDLTRLSLVEWLMKTSDWKNGELNTIVEIPKARDCEAEGVRMNMALGTPAVINAYSESNELKKMVVTVEKYEVFDSKEGYEQKDGYEWKVITFSSDDVNGDRSYRYRQLFGYLRDNYYPELFERSYQNTEVQGKDTAVIIHNGEPKDITICFNNEDTDGVKARATYAVLAPKGYDGLTVIVNGDTADMKNLDYPEVYNGEENFACCRLK